MPATRENSPSEEAAHRIEEAWRSGASYLDLSQLQLSEIPDSLARLARLQFLDLSYNQITAIPDSLAQLTRLRTLDLSCNQIAALPDSLSELAQLHDLNLSGNQLTAIPDSLARLASLLILDLSGNLITTISDSLAQLPHLQNLDLSYNGISVIPDSLAQLPHLENLNLCNNRISAIPDSLVGLQNLTCLFLHGNPSLGLPLEVLGPREEEDIPLEKLGVWRDRKLPRPPKEILAYYFAQRSGAKPLNEAKLILVGRGGVGKTSLVKTLLTGGFNRGEEATEGIKISDWLCRLNTSENVTLHVWDFGGQEMMHATHQFFLTARTLYLLVLERRRDGCDDEADYWFRLIRTFGGMDSPVVIVLNKQKQAPFDVNRGAWLEKYATNIRAFVETDCADPKSISRLKEQIQDQVNNLESLKVKFPTRWFAIKEDLARMTVDFLSFADYRALCRTNGEEDQENQDALSGFLHDLGIALNYRNDSRLRFAYVLKPEWVTKGIYALLHAFSSTKGIFAPAEAEQLLGPQGYSVEAVDFLLGLMERFELSFPLSGPRPQLLIPQLLDDQQPPAATDFQPKECLNFGYRYAIVPEGLLPRFIVRTHHLSGPGTRWKSGVILHHTAGDCRALVRADAADKQVRIHVDGPADARRDLLAIIRYNFEVIHSDYGCRPEDLVYPHGVPERPLNLEDLLDLMRAGDDTCRVVLPDRRVIKPPIADLMRAVDSPRPTLKLFLSYAHEDEADILQLRKDLKVMERNGEILTFYDRAILTGDAWEPRLLQELNDSDIIVCQLSRDFLNSDFCVLKELNAAIERKQRGEAELVAYVLHDCQWQKIPNLSRFQILDKPIRTFQTEHQYWTAIAEAIQKVVDALRASPRPDRRAYSAKP